MSDKSWVLEHNDEMVAKLLDGKTFQIHIIVPGKIRLYLVEIGRDDGRCPVIVGGEQCGLQRGHTGKHMWSNGD